MSGAVLKKQVGKICYMDYAAEKIVSKLNLEPHPEGGYFRETYRSAHEIPGVNLDDRYTGGRNLSTCIYFLLTSDNFSAFHRINQDEIWHFYLGAPLRLHVITHEGEYFNLLIGNDISKGQTPQYVVNGGNWFAAEVVDRNAYSLIGCTVSPGFDYRDFELASRSYLQERFPKFKEVILRLTRS